MRAGAIWGRVRRRLSVEFGEDVFSSWFKSIEIDRADGNDVRLSVATRFLKSWIDANYKDRIVDRWSEEAGRRVSIEFCVRSAGGARLPVRPRAAGEVAPRPMTAAASPQPVVPAMSGVEGLPGSPLDPRLTFDSFVQGRSNTLARAAALQVAQSRSSDAVLFNPLYIHAGVGLGKTHLLQAVAGAAQASGRRVLYLTAEKFTFGFVAALKNQTAIAFKEALRSIDLLVIDDLQFLQGKQTQAEFCHTLNALIDAGRQIVVAGDRPPSDLDGMDERVRSRLAGGLTVEIGTLDEGLRLDILRQKLDQARVQHQGFDVPQQVLAYIARNVTQNGRDLDGAFTRLLANNRLTSQPVTIEMAERSIRDLVRVAEPKRIKIEDIQKVVAQHYNVSRSDILSARRTASVVRPRQVAMYLSKTLTLRSLPEIGRRFGGRDHTTVLHAVRKIENLAGQDRALNEEIETLKRRLND
ncbi:chromosomal replication initiator protein DnaA [Phreatobacter sp.]|uniref:chromosomal replication initiator protein DnaA n=1 Tax=Phreatobacter sp. TaxID=1966341 RepID=UPI003F726B26